jgi:hypothetical protein
VDGALADASSCHPGNVATFTPSAYRSATPVGQNVCMGTMMQDYYEACFGTGKDAAACAMFIMSHPECAACILTADTAKRYGPLVSSGGFVQVNFAACIEVSDPDALLCAKAVQAVSDCELAACKANCPVTDSISLTAYDSCASLADSTGCAAYQSAAACFGAELDGSLPPACNAASFKDFYDAIVPLFCGPPRTNSTEGGAGAEASSSDASAEAFPLRDGSFSDASVEASAGDAGGGDAAGRGVGGVDAGQSDAPAPEASSDDAAGHDAAAGDAAF